MPRKSRTELALIPHLRDHHRRISPPAGMSPEETVLFKEIVEASPAMHFAQSDAPLLKTYCQSIIVAGLAFQSALESPDRLSDWEKACPVMAMLARQLRLTPQARTDPKSLTRQIIGTAMRETLTPETLIALRDGTAGRGWKVKA